MLYANAYTIFIDKERHDLVSRENLAAFFGVSVQVIQGWQSKEVIHETTLRRPRRNSFFFDLGDFFDENRRLTFVPPSWGRLLEDNLDSGEKVEEMLEFLGRMRSTPPSAD